MSEISILLINGQAIERIESDYAIDQIEAHETVSFDADGVTYNIPFHAINVVAVDRTITPVTHEDANCGGGVTPEPMVCTCEGFDVQGGVGTFDGQFECGDEYVLVNDYYWAGIQFYWQGHTSQPVLNIELSNPDKFQSAAYVDEDTSKQVASVTRKESAVAGDSTIVTVTVEGADCQYQFKVIYQPA